MRRKRSNQASARSARQRQRLRIQFTAVYREIQAPLLLTRSIRCYIAYHHMKSRCASAASCINDSCRAHEHNEHPTAYGWHAYVCCAPRRSSCSPTSLQIVPIAYPHRDVQSNTCYTIPAPASQTNHESTCRHSSRMHPVILPNSHPVILPNSHPSPPPISHQISRQTIPRHKTTFHSPILSRNLAQPRPLHPVQIFDQKHARIVVVECHVQNLERSIACDVDVQARTSEVSWEKYDFEGGEWICWAWMLDD
jgi:hypothetical protein